MSESVDTPDEEPPQRAIRLVFQYEGDDVRLVSQARIDKVLPQTDQSADATSYRGTWSEVRDGDGATLDRRVLVDPLPDRRGNDQGHRVPGRRGQLVPGTTSHS